MKAISIPTKNVKVALIVILAIWLVGGIVGMIVFPSSNEPDPTDPALAQNVDGGSTQDPTVQDTSTITPDTEEPQVNPTENVDDNSFVEGEPRNNTDNTFEEDTVFYATCAEVIDAGLAPLFAGDAGYANHLDRDADGVACDSAADKASTDELVYATCADARAAGVTPLLEGENGYGAHLDLDGDGVACG